MNESMKKSRYEAASEAVFLENLFERINKYESKKRHKIKIMQVIGVLLIAFIPIVSLNLTIEKYQPSTESHKNDISHALAHLQIETENQRNQYDLIGYSMRKKTPCSDSFTC